MLSKHLCHQSAIGYYICYYCPPRSGLSSWPYSAAGCKPGKNTRQQENNQRWFFHSPLFPFVHAFTQKAVKAFKDEAMNMPASERGFRRLLFHYPEAGHTAFLPINAYHVKPGSIGPCLPGYRCMPYRPIVAEAGLFTSDISDLHCCFSLAAAGHLIFMISVTGFGKPTVVAPSQPLTPIAGILLFICAATAI